MNLAEIAASGGRFGGEDLVRALELFDALTDRPRWHLLAACRGYGPEAFYDDQEAAKATCRRCLVREECADEGQGERYGVWGGLSEDERRETKRQAS